MKIRIKSRQFLLITLALLFGCSGGLKEKGSKEYIAEIKAWHKRRIENLKKENGWLNLAGLYWLKEGINTVGSDTSNDIVFPRGKAAEFIGKFVKHDSIITMFVNKDVKVFHDGVPVDSVLMIPDVRKGTTILSHRSLKWFVIKRGKDKYGVRLRDLDSPLLKSFKGIKYFPINEDFRIRAKFVPFEKPKKINIPTVIGIIDEELAPGKLVFEIGKKSYRLLPVNDGDDFFIIFADKTSGSETYGGGRFLVASTPDSNGTVILDFNKAYNPPCAFTPYATCPLPPKENYLPLKILAGEKTYGHGH